MLLGVRAVLLLLVAGCSTDVCGPFGGQTCIALEVKGTPAIDQLGIAIDQILTRQLTPNPARATPVAPPVFVAVLPGEKFSPTEPLRIFVDALRDNTLVGQALGELQMRPGSHVSAAITLTDLTVTPDLAGADFSGSDLRQPSDLGPGGPAFFEVNNGLFGGEIITVLADFAVGSAYVGTGGAGVFKTTNSGASWSAANTGLDAININSIASDDITGTIYLTGLRADGTAALYKTTNSAQSWTKVIDLATGGPVLATADSLANTVLFVGQLGSGGILRSTDGMNFTAKNVGLTDPSVTALVADPLTKGTLYAGTQSQKVFQTTNFGDSWSSVSTGVPSGSSGITALKFDPHTQDLVAGTRAGLFTRLFGQASFSAYTPTPPISDVTAFDFFQSASPDLYAGGPTGIFHLDGSKTAWSNASSGLTDKSVTSLETDRTSSTLVYAGTQFSGMFVSSNAGASWAPSNQGITNLSVLTVAIDPTNANVVYAGSQHAGVFKTSNAGATWAPVNSGLPLGAGIAAIAIHPVSSSTLFVATQDVAGTGGVVQALFRSGDGGASWTQVDPNFALAVAIDPSNPTNVYSGTTSGTVRKSIDTGSNFMSVGSTALGIQALVVDPSNSQILYAGTGTGVFKSGNGGASFTAATSGIIDSQINSLAIDPSSPALLWAAGFNSVYRTSDGASSWQQVANGISGQDFRSIVFGGGVVYTSSSGGIFRSNDGSNWFKLTGGAPAQDIALAPNDANTLYFAHIGRSGVTKTVSGGM
jgi:ligand-binding sensor domain-containing protein